MATHLQELMNQDTRLVHHRDVQWTPVLEEREIKQMLVDREVVVCSVVVRGCRWAASRTCADAWCVARFHGLLVQDLWARRGVGKGGEIQPVRAYAEIEPWSAVPDCERRVNAANLSPKWQSGAHLGAMMVWCKGLRSATRCRRCKQKGRWETRWKRRKGAAASWLTYPRDRPIPVNKDLCN